MHARFCIHGRNFSYARVIIISQPERDNDLRSRTFYWIVIRAKLQCRAQNRPLWPRGHSKRHRLFETSSFRKCNTPEICILHWMTRQRSPIYRDSRAPTPHGECHENLRLHIALFATTNSNIPIVPFRKCNFAKIPVFTAAQSYYKAPRIFGISSAP